jgi:hypothetical protein
MFAMVGFQDPDILLPASVDLRHWLVEMWEAPSMWPRGITDEPRQAPLSAHEVVWDDDPFEYLAKGFSPISGRRNGKQA